MSAEGNGEDPDSQTSDDDMLEVDSDDTVREEEITVSSAAERLKQALLDADNARIECEIVPEATRRMVVDCFSLGVRANDVHILQLIIVLFVLLVFLISHKRCDCSGMLAL